MGPGGPWSWNNRILFPARTYNLSFDPSERPSNIVVKVTPPDGYEGMLKDYVLGVRDVVSTILMRGRKTQSFELGGVEDNSGTEALVFATIHALLYLTTLFSMLVGAINIMNIMLVTVTSGRARSACARAGRHAQRHRRTVPRGDDRRDPQTALSSASRSRWCPGTATLGPRPLGRGLAVPRGDVVDRRSTAPPDHRRGVRSLPGLIASRLIPWRLGASSDDTDRSPRVMRIAVSRHGHGVGKTIGQARLDRPRGEDGEPQQRQGGGLVEGGRTRRFARHVSPMRRSRRWRSTARRASAARVPRRLDARTCGKDPARRPNPLEFSKGMPPTLTISNTDSLGEAIQRQLPDVRVVKTLNTMNCRVMVDPARVPGEHDVFVAGNDPEARAQVARWLKEWFGWKAPIDLGDITASHGLEMWLPLWIRITGSLKTGDFNLRIVR